MSRILDHVNIIVHFAKCFINDALSSNPIKA